MIKLNNVIIIKKNINIIIIKKKKNILILYINSKNIFLSIKLKKMDLENLFLNKNLNFLKIKKSNEFNYFAKINVIFNTIFYFIIEKINFNGKGFKLKKSQKRNIFNFNNSHIKMHKENYSLIIKNNKNYFLWIYKKKKNLTKYFLFNLFKINIFTKRGVKFSERNLMYKKTKKK